MEEEIPPLIQAGPRIKGGVVPPTPPLPQSDNGEGETPASPPPPGVDRSGAALASPPPTADPPAPHLLLKVAGTQFFGCLQQPHLSNRLAPHRQQQTFLSMRGAGWPLPLCRGGGAPALHILHTIRSPPSSLPSSPKLGAKSRTQTCARVLLAGPLALPRPSTVAGYQADQCVQRPPDSRYVLWAAIGLGLGYRYER